MSKLFLGIDTSNYTTSIGVIDEELNIIQDRRIILSVDKGNKGLRQQEALFQHLKNLPFLVDSLEVDFKEIVGIGVSTKPRNQTGSYMPVFLAGEGLGRSLSKVLNVPLKRFSHQEGHIGASLIHNNIDGSFISFHLSGGTTEVLKCKNLKDNINLELVGGTLDISVGQLIDRIGVYIGFNFPCGKEMDNFAQHGNPINLDIIPKIKNGYVNLSGIENKFISLINTNIYKKEDIIYTLFYQIAYIINNLIEYTLKDSEEKVVLVGGVVSNSIIRDILNKSKHNEQIVFTDMGLSVDNAVGIAYLTLKKLGWEE